MKLKKKQIIKLMQWLISHEELENTSGISEHTAKHYFKEFMETQETVKSEQKLNKLNMENKYYTPNFEEFSVGLECEWKQDLQDFTVDEWVQNWSKHTITRDDFIDRGLANEFTSIYRLNKWRVKYLDEQDIFDCGFEYTNNKRDLIKDNVRVRTYIGEHFEIPNIAIYKDKIRVFRGKIKNKTDFKKLLSQLGI